MKLMEFTCRCYSVDVNKRPVVIWGHKSSKTPTILRRFVPDHTHSHIHRGYFKAFSSLGFETYWVNSQSEIDSGILKNALVFTEDQVDNDLPVHKNALYITHHSSKSKYQESGVKRLNLCNFVLDLLKGESYNYPGGSVERIGDVSFVDSENKALYQPWATDLLPGQEIEFQPIVRGASLPKLHYVGTTNHDGLRPRFIRLEKAAKDYGLQFRAHKGVSEQAAIDLIRASSFAFDLRGDWHLERGYIPCRIWKSMSYGRAVSSNSPGLEEIFGDRVMFASDESELVNRALAVESNPAALSLIRDNQMWVASNHTFLNRAKTILEAVSNLL